jgi:hypothetical protein
MGTIKLHIDPDTAIYRSATAFPQYVKAEGTTGPITGLAFDASSEEAVFFRFRAQNYGASSPSITVFIGWYADTATSGVVMFGVSLAAITANTDTQDVETKAFATETTFTDTHLGTVGQRAHDAIGSISTNLDSLVADDWVSMKLARKAADASDTMAGDCVVTTIDLSWSDT